jgi:hypothetical protein
LSVSGGRADGRGSGAYACSRSNSTHVFDSVLHKQDLTISQIRKYTTLDSIYFTGRLAENVFTGDTVVDFGNGMKGVVINYSDRLVASYKRLFLFKPPYDKSIGDMEVYNNVDCTEDQDCSFVDYKITSDSTFELIETIVPANAEERKLSDSIIRYTWKVKVDGTFMQVSVIGRHEK